MADILIGPPGAVAQLVERIHGMDEAARSIRVSSTFISFVEQVGFTLGGLVAGEGSFIIRPVPKPFPDGSKRFRFGFQVKMARRDRPILEALQTFLGMGSVGDSPARRSGWQPESTYDVTSIKAARSAVIPFAERFLLDSAKRRQFESWRDKLVCYVAAHPEVERRRGICSMEGCDEFIRGRGLCRSHYYAATGY